eukprot:scaffold74948_cov49-Attheya_sp.AAC.3
MVIKGARIDKLSNPPDDDRTEGGGGLYYAGLKKKSLVFSIRSSYERNKSNLEKIFSARPGRRADHQANKSHNDIKQAPTAAIAFLNSACRYQDASDHTIRKWRQER